MAATALVTALGGAGADFGDAQVANRTLDLKQQDTQSEIAARQAQAEFQRGQLAVDQARQALLQEQAGINYKDPGTGKWKRYDPVSMKTKELPEGFDPTYDPTKDPSAIIRRAEESYRDENGNKIPLPDSIKQRLIAGATGVHLPTTSALKQEPDEASSTGWSWVRRDIEGNEVARSVAPPPAGYAPRVTSTTQTDPMGLTTTTNSTRKTILPGSTPATAGNPAGTASTGAGTGKSALATVLGGNKPSAAPVAGATPTVAPPPAPVAPAAQSGVESLSAQEKRFLPMAQIWATQGTKPPEKYVPFVEAVMKKMDLVPFTEETAAYKNARSSIRDVLPILKALKTELEPRKNDNNFFFGPNSSIDQRGKWLKYTIGGMKPTNPTDADIMQLASFAQVAAAAPWAKIGRGKYVYEQIQKHLPDASKDNAANMYDKVQRLIPIFEAEMERSPSKTGIANWATDPGTANSNPGSALQKVVQSQTPQAKAEQLINQAMQQVQLQKGSAGAASPR